MTQHKLENSDNNRIAMNAHTTTLRSHSLTHTSSMRQRNNRHGGRLQQRPRRLSVDAQPSLFATRRNNHAKEQNALQHATDQFYAMHHGHHARQLTHDQYLDFQALQQEATGHTGLTPKHSFQVPKTKTK